MERLTQWIGEDEDRRAIPKPDIRSNGHGRCCNKLAEYEDAEEQGLLVKLPCKVGDTVYVPTSILISEFKITAIFCDTLGTYFYWLFYCGIYDRRTSGFRERDIGKTVFLTREEAEKKLEEMQNAENA